MEESPRLMIIHRIWMRMKLWRIMFYVCFFFCIPPWNHISNKKNSNFSPIHFRTNRSPTWLFSLSLLCVWVDDELPNRDTIFEWKQHILLFICDKRIWVNDSISVIFIRLWPSSILVDTAELIGLAIPLISMILLDLWMHENNSNPVYSIWVQKKPILNPIQTNQQQIKYPTK